MVHGYTLTVDAFTETLEWVADADPAKMKSYGDISAGRLPLLPAAAEVLQQVLAQFAPAEVVISAFGLREGLLYQSMPLPLRKADPLIEGARHIEARQARFAGYGDVLFDWLGPLRRMLDPKAERWMLAACLLHDTFWRLHPNDRADLCFENLSRVNLAGIGHAGRVFIAVASMHRYKAARQVLSDHPVVKLLSKEQQKKAELLGRAMRLAAVISSGDPRALKATSLDLTDGHLTLAMASDGLALEGEVVERRLTALANRMDVTSSIENQPAFYLSKV